MKKDTFAALDFNLKNYFQVNAPEERVSRCHKKLHVPTNLEVSEGLEIRFKAGLKGTGVAKVSVMDSDQWSNEMNPKFAIRVVKNDNQSSAFEVDYLDSKNVKWRAKVPLNQDISAPNRYCLQLNPASTTSPGSLSLKLNSTLLVD